MIHLGTLNITTLHYLIRFNTLRLYTISSQTSSAETVNGQTAFISDKSRVLINVQCTSHTNGSGPQDRITGLGDAGGCRYTMLCFYIYAHILTFFVSYFINPYVDAIIADEGLPNLDRFFYILTTICNVYILDFYFF